MRKRATLTLAATIAIACSTSAARAHSEYIQYIPNGTLKQCNNCHPVGNTLALNVMGEDTVPVVGKPKEQWWPLLRDLDSDGDGQTNAQELGDPCGEWAIGLEPGRKTNISNPGNPNETSATPDEPPCDGPTGSSGSTGGGSPTTTSSGTTTTAGDEGGGGSSSAGPTGGQGASKPSTGAGKADGPLSTGATGACATSPSAPSTSGLGAALALLAAAALFLTRPRRSSPRPK